MEADADLGQERLEIFATEIRVRGIPNLLEHVAASLTRLSVHSRKGNVVISRLEVALLLLRELR